MMQRRVRLTETSDDREDDHGRVRAPCRRDRNCGSAEPAQLRRQRTGQLRLLRLVLYRHRRVQLPRHSWSRTVDAAVSALSATAALPAVPAAAAMAVAAAVLNGG